ARVDEQRRHSTLRERLARMLHADLLPALQNPANVGLDSETSAELTNCPLQKAGVLNVAGHRAFACFGEEIEEVGGAKRQGDREEGDDNGRRRREDQTEICVAQSSSVIRLTELIVAGGVAAR